jgi:hypothetical protein
LLSPITAVRPVPGGYSTYPGVHSGVRWLVGWWVS